MKHCAVKFEMNFIFSAMRTRLGNAACPKQFEFDFYEIFIEGFRSSKISCF